MDTQNMRQLVNRQLEDERRDAANRRLVGRTRHRHAVRIRVPWTNWFGGHRPARRAPKPTTA